MDGYAVAVDDEAIRVCCLLDNREREIVHPNIQIERKKREGEARQEHFDFCGEIKTWATGVNHIYLIVISLGCTGLQRFKINTDGLFVLYSTQTRNSPWKNFRVLSDSVKMWLVSCTY